VWEMIQSSEVLESLGIGGAWFITICLLVAGAVGCVVPILPGHLILLIAVIAHRLMLGEAAGVAWWSFVVLVLLMAISQTFEILSGAAGSKWFGGTRWGAIGALIGGLAGFFFFPIGLLLGPLIGAFLFEMAFAKQQARPAVISGVGSVVGTMSGLVCKIVVGILMTGWFLLDVFVLNF
jgi:uncharacterized protein